MCSKEYQRSMKSVPTRDIGLRNSKFVAKSQFKKNVAEKVLKNALIIQTKKSARLVFYISICPQILNFNPITV